jgi:tRNA dimethylallyltransferase
MVILIAGPTASGKSALALDLAAKYGGVIINADSMQVYRDLRIITARPSPEDETRAPHRLYGHVDAAENYSVGRWFGEAAAALKDALRNQQPALLVGGTGLYLSTLTRGIAAVPPIPAEIRREVRGRLTAEGVAALQAELAVRDPVTSARLKPGDRARISRALEVVLATGRSLSEWHADNTPPPVDLAGVAKIFLMPKPNELGARIDARFDAMMAAGALEEVRALAARHLDSNLPAMKAHGVPWLIRHLKGDITLAEAVAQAKRDTRRYTKRQGTWFRNQLPQFEWVEPQQAAAAVDAQLSRLSLSGVRALRPAGP